MLEIHTWILDWDGVGTAGIHGPTGRIAVPITPEQYLRRDLHVGVAVAVQGGVIVRRIFGAPDWKAPHA